MQNYVTCLTLPFHLAWEGTATRSLSHLPRASNTQTSSLVRSVNEKVLQAEVLKFVPRLSVARDNENILRRAIFTELKFNATTVKMMGPFIDIYKNPYTCCRMLFTFTSILHNFLESSGTHNEYDNDDTCR